MRAIEGTGAQVLDTRKTTPGLRLLEKAAVRAGGALNHRIGLWDQMLIKNNHADMAGGVGAAVRLRARRIPTCRWRSNAARSPTSTRRWKRVRRGCCSTT